MISILMLYAANIIVPDVKTVTEKSYSPRKMITGKTLLRLTTNK